MFNSEQEEHMRYLATLPPEKKCKCGWYERGDCPNCSEVEGGMKRPTGPKCEACAGKGYLPPANFTCESCHGWGRLFEVTG